MKIGIDFMYSFRSEEDKLVAVEEQNVLADSEPFKSKLEIVQKSSNRKQVRIAVSEIQLSRSKFTPNSLSE